ncbi:MAG: ABC transporter ATP-binding protein [Bacteroidota bacterium]
MSEVLHINELHIGYQDGSKTFSVATNLNACLKKGELVCILGPNGIGKSTFIKTISGLHKPISGTVEVNNVNINNISNKERANHLSVVLTGRPPFNLITVRELVELGRYAHTNWKHSLSKEDIMLVDEAIEAVDLSNESGRLVAELSDGNAQKAMIASTLAQNADLILLDEPTVHLDVSNKTMIMQLLVNLAKNHQKSILLSSHDLNMMSQIADKLWLFKSDEIVSGIPEDLILNGVVEEILGTEELELHHLKKKNITVSLDGDNERIHWLSKALIRNGYVVDEKSSISINADIDKFELYYTNEKRAFNSIEEIIKGLDKLNDGQKDTQ